MTGQDEPAESEPATRRPGASAGRGPRPEPGEGLAALTGSGSSIVGVDGALRARDVSRPSAADLAAAASLPVRRATPPAGEG
jgi:hypothetical protein